MAGRTLCWLLVVSAAFPGWEAEVHLQRRAGSAVSATDRQLCDHQLGTLTLGCRVSPEAPFWPVVEGGAENCFDSLT